MLEAGSAKWLVSRCRSSWAARAAIESLVKNRWHNGATLNLCVQYVVAWTGCLCKGFGDAKRVVILHIHRTGTRLLQHVREILMQPLVCKICSGYDMAHEQHFERRLQST